MFQAVKKYSNTTLNVFVMTVKDYLGMFWSTLSGVLDLYESLSAALKTRNKGMGKFPDFIDIVVVNLCFV